VIAPERGRTRSQEARREMELNRRKIIAGQKRKFAGRTELSLSIGTIGRVAT
jgi:hypothetical protein